MKLVSSNESLSNKARRWKSALQDASTGPLIIAGEVTSLAERWEEHKREAGGLRCTAWLRKTFGDGRGLSWFQDRAEAVAYLGEASRRYVHHEAAVWVKNHVPKDSLDKVKFMLRSEQKKNGGNPLTKAQAVRRVNAMLGKGALKSRHCKRCQELEAKLREHGIEA